MSNCSMHSTYESVSYLFFSSPNKSGGHIVIRVTENKALKNDLDFGTILYIASILKINILHNK